MEEDEDGNEYYYYDSSFNYAGDILTVHYENEDVEYTYHNEDDEDIFVSDDGEEIDGYNVEMFTNQEEVHWTVGSNNYLTARYYPNGTEGEYDEEAEEYTESEYFESDPIPVTIVENRITGATYIPKKQVTYMENVDGYWSDEYYDDDEYEGERFFRYNLPYSKDGDVIRLTYKDGTREDFEYDSDEEEYISESGESIDDYYVEFDHNQFDKHWEVGSDNEYTVSVYGFETTLYVTIEANPVEDFEVVRSKAVTYYEHINGQWEENEDDGTSFFYYHAPYWEKGDKLQIKYKDPSVGTVEYTFKSDYSCFESEDGEILNDDYIDFETNQWSKHWTIGDNNEYRIKVYGIEKTFYVSIKENPVTSVKVTRAKQFTYYENVNGHMREDEDDNEYFEYYTPYWETGDTFEITYKDSGIGTKKYTYSHGEFRTEDGKILDDDYYDLISNQEEEHWKIGSDNPYTISVFGFEKTFYVTIESNPVKAVSYECANDPVYYLEDESNGSWVTYDGEAYFDYDLPWFGEGDVLTLTYKSTNETIKYTYTYKYDEEEEVSNGIFISEDGKELKPDSDIMYFTDDQYEDHWGVGEQTYYLKAYGFEVELTATVVDGGIKGIKYTPIEKPTYIENNDGYWDTDSDGEDFFNYYDYGFREGDKLLVTDKEGTETEYVFDFGSYCFVSEDGDEISDDELEFEDDQWKNHWYVGDVTYRVFYKGVYDTVTAEIKKNNIKSISINVNRPYTIYDTDYYMENEGVDEPYKCYYYWADALFEQGDTLVVTYDDESTKTYTYVKTEYGGYFNNGGDIIEIMYSDISDNQKNQEWTVGINYVTVDYCGAKAQVPVQIERNSVRSVELKQANQIHVEQNTNGEKKQDYNGNEYYYYNIPLLRDNDELIVELDGGEKVTYKYDSGSKNFVAEGREPISSSDYSVLDYQDWGEFWMPEKENIFYVFYHGVYTTGKVYIDKAEGEPTSEVSTTTQATTTTPESATTTQAQTTTSEQASTTPEQTTTTQATTTTSESATTTQAQTTARKSAVKPTVPMNNKKTTIAKMSAKKKSLKVTWKKVKGVHGYQLQASLKKNFKKTKTVSISNANKSSAIIKKLKKKKKYFVRIRTFIRYNGVFIYSNWSPIKKKKTK